MKPDRYDEENKAALYEAMARAWGEEVGKIDFSDAVLDRMRELRRSGEPLGAETWRRADEAALALLAGPPDSGHACFICGKQTDRGVCSDKCAREADAWIASEQGEPVTPEDLEAMEACPECGGATGWNEGIGYGHSHWATCPPPPDGCGGTGKRDGR